MLMAAFAMLICLSPDAHAKKLRQDFGTAGSVPIVPAQLAHGLAAAVPEQLLQGSTKRQPVWLVHIWFPVVKN